jgi:hypothetical protein
MISYYFVMFRRILENIPLNIELKDTFDENVLEIGSEDRSKTFKDEKITPHDFYKMVKLLVIVVLAQEVVTGSI